MVSVHKSVIGGIRLVEHRKALSVLFPGKPAAVDHDATERRSVPAHEFR